LTVFHILGMGFIVFGVFFYAIGVIGLIRFPDVYMRIHSAGKVSILGIMGLLAGSALLMPESTLKVIALGAFMIITQPVAAHAVALAAYRSGVALYQPHRDDLGRDWSAKGIQVPHYNPAAIAPEGQADDAGN
jgi:multicomponent Na+:H+ antiporter subunit G